MIGVTKLSAAKTPSELWDKYVELLIQANREDVSEEEHIKYEARLQAWLLGVKDATGFSFNGDYYYLPLFESGELKERPICCGVFLDWNRE